MQSLLQKEGGYMVNDKFYIAFKTSQLYNINIFHIQLAAMQFIQVILSVLLQVRLCKPDLYVVEEQVEDSKDSYNTSCVYK